MESFNVKEVFDRYADSSDLKEADIFHLYDTGRECAKDNSGYVDSRHFEVIAFNSTTMQKINLGTHDGITFLTDLPVDMIRIYADGSFFIKLRRPAKIEALQNIVLT